MGNLYNWCEIRWIYRVIHTCSSVKIQNKHSVNLKNSQYFFILCLAPFPSYIEWVIQKYTFTLRSYTVEKQYNISEY